MIHSGPLEEYFRDLGTELDHHTQKFAGQLSAHGLHFEGKPYPVSVRPLLLDRRQALRIQRTVESLYHVLEAAADTYRSEEWARSLFPAYQHAQPWLLAWPRSRPETTICRFDGVIDRQGNFQLFETNTASPGGVIQTGMAVRLWREAAAEWDIPLPQAVHPQPLVENPDLFGRTIIDDHITRTGSRPETAAITNLKGRFTNEAEWMCSALERLGVRTKRTDAREIRRGPRGRAEAGGWGPVDLSYNKLSPRELISDPKAADYLAAGADGSLSFLNPLIAQCVLEDKAVLALLTDPRFLASLLPPQQQLVRQHVPWTRLLTTGETMTWDGATDELPDVVTAAREHLVLKPSNLTRGEGVIIGPKTSPANWHRAVLTATKAGTYVVQKYITLPRIDVPGALGLTSMVHGIDTYLFGGNFAGFHSRASLDPVVNIGKRGALLPVVISGE